MPKDLPANVLLGSNSSYSSDLHEDTAYTGMAALRCIGIYLEVVRTFTIALKVSLVADRALSKCRKVRRYTRDPLQKLKAVALLPHARHFSPARCIPKRLVNWKWKRRQQKHWNIFGWLFRATRMIARGLLLLSTWLSAFCNASDQRNGSTCRNTVPKTLLPSGLLSADLSYTIFCRDIAKAAALCKARCLSTILVASASPSSSLTPLFLSANVPSPRLPLIRPSIYGLVTSLSLSLSLSLFPTPWPSSSSCPPWPSWELAYTLVRLLFPFRRGYILSIPSRWSFTPLVVLLVSPTAQRKENVLVFHRKGTFLPF